MKTNETWKPVTISGITGILMGAGTVYGVQAFANTSNGPESETEDLVMAMDADQNLSFKQAFDTARAELGPGGVFTWRGNIYNTYTADEWHAMSNEERNLFATRVKPEVSAAEVDEEIADNDENVVTEAESEETEEVEVEEVAVAEDNVEAEEDDTANVSLASWDDLVNEDNDVRIIGYEDVEIGDGRTVAVQGLEVNGQRVAIIDVDKDGVADLAMSDLNHNFKMDDGEVIDLHTGEAVSFSNDDYAANINDAELFDGGAI